MIGPHAHAARIAALTILLLDAFHFEAAVARACTCPSTPAAVVTWPEDSATDVAVDTPIALTLVDYAADAQDATIRLVDEVGRDVPLAVTQRVSPSWNGCGAAELVFVRPSRNLDSGVTYTVLVAFPRNGEPQSVSTFTVGDQSFMREAPIAAEVGYLKAYPNPSCVEPGCNALGEVRVKLEDAPDSLLWLVIASGASAHSQNHWPFRPVGSGVNSAMTEERRQAAQLSVVLGAHDDCVDIRIYGREGRALLEEHRCSPDRCATSDVTAISTCGAPPSSTIDLTRVPEGSCQHSHLAHFSRGTLVEPDAGLAAANPQPSSMPSHGFDPAEEAPPGTAHAGASHHGGCNGVPQSSNASSIFDSFIALIAWILVVLRPRRLRG